MRTVITKDETPTATEIAIFRISIDMGLQRHMSMT